MTIISEEDVEKALISLIEKAYKEGYLSGAAGFIGETDADMKEAQDYTWSTRAERMARSLSAVLLSREAKDEKPDPKSKRGTRLPDDWIIPDSWAQWALANLICNAPQVFDQYTKFKDYWISKSGSGATKVNWEATWRLWCRKEFRPKSLFSPSKALGIETNPDGSMERIAIDQDSETFRAITRLRKGTAPFTGRDGKAWVSQEEIERAKNA